MKGSSLHRAGLTREKMSLLASFLGQGEKKQTVRTQSANHGYKAAKNHELDILWGGVKGGIQKVHNATKTSSQKSPAVYIIIGFIAGVLFMSLITFIVSVSTMAPKAVEKIENANNKANVGEVVVPSEDETTAITTATEDDQISSQEKYIVKQGDTLNGIAYRFYGKYDEAKIKEIQRINNLVNPEALKIDQELIIPLYQDR